MNTYEKIGKKLQPAREKAGFSQEELAKRIGCTQTSLSNYELGKRRLYPGDLQRIGLLLGKQVTYFLDETEEEPTLSLDEFNRIIKEQYLHEILPMISERVKKSSLRPPPYCFGIKNELRLSSAMIFEIGRIYRSRGAGRQLSKGWDGFSSWQVAGNSIRFFSALSNGWRAGP